MKAELPDMAREDIDITVDNGTLTIRGRKNSAGEVKEEAVTTSSSGGTALSRSSLPRPWMPRKSARLKTACLTVRLPLREEAKPRQIKIDVA